MKLKNSYFKNHNFKHKRACKGNPIFIFVSWCFFVKIFPEYINYQKYIIQKTESSFEDGSAEKMKNNFIL